MLMDKPFLDQKFLEGCCVRYCLSVSLKLFSIGAWAIH